MSKGQASLRQDLSQALQMLDAFTSVGATHFDLTFLDIDGERRGFRPHQTARQLNNSLPLLFPGLTERGNSLVIRPHSKQGITLVQIDDVNAQALERLKDVAFLTLETSPGNHQAWVAVPTPASPRDLAPRLRKATGADTSPSGSTRVAGTLNYKRKYEPDFPTVCIVSTAPGQIVTAQYRGLPSLHPMIGVLTENTLESCVSSTCQQPTNEETMAQSNAQCPLSSSAITAVGPAPSRLPDTGSQSRYRCTSAGGSYRRS